ncbi:MAG: hypothetical protein GX025_06330, partial [Clostridiales bacterium]|nr:hypothetical protein [Clostridiales bacterium]
NSQLLPFERNRYYVGKLLTSADFQVEQVYGSQKRRFINEMMFGGGIVCGLGVYSLDDLSIMIESGLALDFWGREIVVENSVMKKLSAIDGFEELQTNRAVLCLKYDEQAVHPVYAVSAGNQGEGYEHNRIREGYSLCLFDRAALPENSLDFSAFISTSVLYEDSDFRVSLSLPSSIPCNQAVRLRVSVTQLSSTGESLTLQIPLQTPALLNEEGEHSLDIKIDELSCGQGKTITRDYKMTARPVPSPDSTLMAATDSISVKVGGVSRSATEPFLLKISVTELSSESVIAKAIGSVSLEARNIEGSSELIELAEFSLQRTKSAYLIESVIEDGVKKYIKANADDSLRREYRDWFLPLAPQEENEKNHSGTEGSPSGSPREPVYASGVCEIPLPAGLKSGQVVYSDEIIHGLGKGLIYVSAGFEYFAEDKKLGATARHTLYGDPDLFEGDNLSIPASSLAVKVLNDRGSFVIAVKIYEPSPMVVLTLRWNAFSFPIGEESAKLQKLEGKSISAVRPTVVMGARESHYFSVNFKNMEPCTLTYELTEKDSGQITPDGIYTAPAKEGIYEIRISCADMPLITTYAYAVVKKHLAQETESVEAQV